MGFLTYKIDIPNWIMMFIAAFIVVSIIMLGQFYNENVRLKAENNEIKTLSLVDFTSAFVVESNEILIIDRKTNEVKYVITDTLALQILSVKEFQLQVMEYEKIISE